MLISDETQTIVVLAVIETLDKGKALKLLNQINSALLERQAT